MGAQQMGETMNALLFCRCGAACGLLAALLPPGGVGARKALGGQPQSLSALPARLLAWRGVAWLFCAALSAQAAGAQHAAADRPPAGFGPHVKRPTAAARRHGQGPPPRPIPGRVCPAYPAGIPGQNRAQTWLIEHGLGRDRLVAGTVLGYRYVGDDTRAHCRPGARDSRPCPSTLTHNTARAIHSAGCTRCALSNAPPRVAQFSMANAVPFVCHERTITPFCAG